MTSQVLFAVLAVSAGLTLGLGLFVPTVAVIQRKRGTVPISLVLSLLAALVYFLALWTYTLLPLPDPDGLVCAGTNLDPGTLVTDVRAGILSPVGPLRDPGTLQLALNVLLFIPLGFLIRLLTNKGVVVSMLTGFVVSLFVETAQLTGMWGIYPCAYRVFDVVDLMMNTLGALVGSLLAFALFGRRRENSSHDPRVQTRTDTGLRTVTRSRRFLGAACDTVASIVLYSALFVATQVGLNSTGNQSIAYEGSLSEAIGTVGTVLVLLTVTLATGQTVGDIAVQIRYAEGPLPRTRTRALRFVGGVGGYLLLGLLPVASTLLQPIGVIVYIWLFFSTPSGSGLPGVLTKSQVIDVSGTRVST